MIDQQVLLDGPHFEPWRRGACFVCVVLTFGIYPLCLLLEQLRFIVQLLILLIPLSTVVSGVLLATFPGFHLNVWQRAGVFLLWLLVIALALVLEFVVLMLFMILTYDFDMNGIQ